MRKNESGLIKTIILIVIALAFLSYLGFNLRNFIESDIVQENFSYAWNWVKHVWNTYLVRPASYLWNDVWVDLFWEPFIDAMQKIKVGESPALMDSTPSVNFD